jgi:hypothetical protein
MKFLYSFIVLLLGLVFPAAAQQFRNLRFDQACDSSKTGLCYWDLSWGNKGSVKSSTDGNSKSLLIMGMTENSVGFVEQESMPGSLQSLSILTFSAMIKSDSVNGKGAGLNIALYNKSGQLISNKDMGGFYSLDWIRGITGWKKHSISIICPTQTNKIKIGLILYGKGKAWFKNCTVTTAP